VYLVAILVEAPNTHDVGREFWDEVHPIEAPELVGLAHELHSSVLLDLSCRVITELDCSLHMRVEINKCCTGPSHMVGRSSVNNPHHGILIIHRLAELNKDLFFMDHCNTTYI
jgi:hypothetical protein